MADHWQILFAYALFMLIAQVHSQRNDNVPLTIVTGAKEKGTVCIDGTPAGYHYAPGFGDGVNNWLVDLMGGGWCWEKTCLDRIGQWNGSTKNITTAYFRGILSSNPKTNPDFYNWNRVWVRYCDGSSFIGDIEANATGIQVQLRGSRIFSAIMDELLQKGMRSANNAILAGGSAGGLATILHCDGFRALLPNANRVKCLSDGGFFIRAKDLPYHYTREWVYDAAVKFHNLTDYLPKSCTSKMNSSLCLFPEYLVGDVQTPLFILNSAFDSFQIHDNMERFPAPESWERCTKNITNNCTPAQRQRIKDFGNAFLETLKGLAENPSRGLFINNCYIHGMMEDYTWTSSGYGLENKSAAQAFADWYFDRSSVRLINTHSDFPAYC